MLPSIKLAAPTLLRVGSDGGATVCETPSLRVAGVGVAGMAGEAGIMPSKTTISSSSLNLRAAPVIRTTLYEIRSRERKLACLRLGAKMAIGPTSRFTAVACYSGMIVIFEANRGSKSYQEGPRNCYNVSAARRLYIREATSFRWTSPTRHHTIQISSSLPS